MWFVCLFFQVNPRYPVNSFSEYNAKLNPSDSNLWQRPANEVSETKSVWYDNATLSRNMIATMVLNISKDAEQLVIYINPCIIFACITYFDRKGVDARIIVDISGHKNISSIMSISAKLSEKKQFEIPKIFYEISSKSAYLSQKNAKSSRVDFIKRYKHRKCRDLGCHCCWYYTIYIVLLHSLKVFASQAEGWIFESRPRQN